MRRWLIVALVSLARAPSERVSLGGRKWLWVVVILVGELVGPIAYFVGGRLPAVADDATPEPAVGLDRQAKVVDALYGPADAALQEADQSGTADAGHARRRR